MTHGYVIELDAGVTAVYRDLIARIEAIAEELDGIAFDRLREAVADGEVVRPTSDRRLMQARRALEKATAVLTQLDEGLSADDQST